MTFNLIINLIENSSEQSEEQERKKKEEEDKGICETIPICVDKYLHFFFVLFYIKRSE